FHSHPPLPALHSFPTRRSSDLLLEPVKFRDVVNESARNQLPHERFSTAFDVHRPARAPMLNAPADLRGAIGIRAAPDCAFFFVRSEEHTSELQSRSDLVCRLLL